MTDTQSDHSGSDSGPKTDHNPDQDHDHDHDHNHGQDTAPPEEPYKDPDWMRTQYLERGKSQREIAEMIDRGQKTVSTWLHKHNIDTTGPNSPATTYQQKAWLKTEYVQKGKSIDDIATEYNSSFATICEWLGRHDIEIQ